MSLEPFKQRALLLKVETTEGTDAVPTAGLNAFQLFEGKSSVTGATVERSIDRPFFSHDPFVMANLRASVEGSFEIVPPSTPGDVTLGIASVDALLQIGGTARTLTVGPPGKTRYNPISSAIPSGTAYWYHAGTFRKVLGARAALSGISMEIGNYLKGQAKIEGSYVDVTEDTVSGLVYTSFATPRVASTESMALTVNSVAVEGKALSLDFGSEQKTIEHTEARVNRITDRRSTFTSRFYRPSLASFDPWAIWRAGTIVPIIGTHLEADGRSTVLTVRAQIEAVNEVDIDGDYGIEVTGRCIASSSGGDEFLLEFNAA